MIANGRAVAPTLWRLPPARGWRAAAPTTGAASLAGALFRRTFVAISVGILRPSRLHRQFALRTPLLHKRKHKHDDGQHHHRPGDRPGEVHGPVVGETDHRIHERLFSERTE